MTVTKKTVCVRRFQVAATDAGEFSMSGKRIAGFSIDTTAWSEAPSIECLTAHEAETRLRDVANVCSGDGGMIEARLNPVGQSSIDRTCGERLMDEYPPGGGIASTILLRNTEASSNVRKSGPIAHLGQDSLQSNNTLCMPEELMFDIRRLDGTSAFARHFQSSSAFNSIAKLASTLP
jgi:hypothetical protein